MNTGVRTIQAAVCEHFHIASIEMVSQRRGRDVARPRQVAMYLSRELTPLSLTAIGREFGGRDHTTVIHAHNTVAGLIAIDPTLAAAVHDITAQLNSGDPGRED